MQEITYINEHSQSNERLLKNVTNLITIKILLCVYWKRFPNPPQNIYFSQFNPLLIFGSLSNYSEVLANFILFQAFLLTSRVGTIFDAHFYIHCSISFRHVLD